MVRGRKRDVSAPLTRSLVLQRDYRARKAKYISDLESRCHKLEIDKERLSKEVEDLKSKLRQKDIDQKETLASLTTEAELEKAHALNNVMFSLSSAAASIKSFQNLTMGPDYDLSKDSPIDQKPCRIPHTPSNTLSALSDPSEFFADDFRPIQLRSPVSDTSRSLSVSSPFDERNDWVNISPNVVLPDSDMDVPAYLRIRAETQNIFPHLQGRSGSNGGFGPLSVSLPRVPLCSTFLENEPGCVPYFENGRARNISSHPHGPSGQTIPFNDVLGILPIASYERTLSQSLQNWK
ncbi:hypothetical protein BDP27DRAFT_1408499 [Rhodocollybia butyracea]|uniref:BZIP domain-containing protein n=1 Tax=Rhodocollybia butyracea TaxID=206335 RepID=A0A9P5P8K0_9AGAR|nr:hypothetical protein BDP27DRAFT_1408499 [Rhodocollybia butyracea]